MVAGASFVILIDNNVFVQLLIDRVASDKLVRYLQQENTSLLIPTPVLAEFLAYDFSQRYIKFFSTMQNSRFQIAPFDQKAAIICGELACELRKIKENSTSKQKVKVDLQIVSIALAMKVKSILTEDTDIANIISNLDLQLKAITIADIPKDLPLFDA
jgi:predicted nucleic acid-binding protein